MAKGKLIVIEGIDGAGKGTQVACLAKRIQRGKNVVTVFSFPQYKKPVGRFIRAALGGQFGDFVSLNAYFSAFPYLIDMLLARAEIEAALKKGTVLCDRYVPSTIAYHSAKLKGVKRREFVSFLERFAYGELGIRKPDAVIYLDMPVKNARALLLADPTKGAKKLDQYEKNISYQKQVAEVYSVQKRRRPWQTVRCAASGRTRTVEEIHDAIWRLIRVKIR